MNHGRVCDVRLPAGVQKAKTVKPEVGVQLKTNADLYLLGYNENERLGDQEKKMRRYKYYP